MSLLRGGADETAEEQGVGGSFGIFHKLGNQIVLLEACLVFGFFSHAWVLHANAGERGAREWAGSFPKEVEGCVAEAESLWTAPLREDMQMGAQD